MSKRELKDKARGLLNPIVVGLSSLGVSPMLMSVFGLIFGLYAAHLISRGSLSWGGVALLVSGLCDVIDGSLARHADSGSRFGAFIDSTFDRVAELAVFSGLIVYYVTRPQGYNLSLVVLVCLVLSASILISYARARLEGLGYTCAVGLMERTERFVLLVAGLLFGRRVLVLMLVVLAVGSVYTVIQRIHHAWVVTHIEPRREEAE